MKSLLFLCIAISLLISPFATAVSAHKDKDKGNEICEKTTLYPLTFPPGEAEQTILCHPVGKALTAANNANLQFNAGEMAAQNSVNIKCPVGLGCDGWSFGKNGFK